MTKRIVVKLAFAATLAGFFFSFALAQNTLQGYVLKAGEGEQACCDVLIKASPLSGSRQAEVLLQPMPPGFSTGIHYHTNFDEFFYVISGSGTALIAGVEHQISAGDSIFVPAGEDHRLMTQAAAMTILEFTDSPGLADEFRAELSNDPSLEEQNAMSSRFGTFYKTLR